MPRKPTRVLVDVKLERRATFVLRLGFLTPSGQRSPEWVLVNSSRGSAASSARSAELNLLDVRSISG